jgi:hypothetical protein
MKKTDAVLLVLLLVFAAGCSSPRPHVTQFPVMHSDPASAFTNTPDSIDRLAASLSAPRGGEPWNNGLFPVLSLPQTASPKEVVQKLFEMGLPRGETPNYRILKIRQVRIRIPEIEPDIYTALLVQKDGNENIVLIKYLDAGACWWSRVFDAN